MRANALTISRRHTKSCSKGYDQNFRIRHPQTSKEWKADCECPIVADGWLRNVPQRVQREGTGTNDWDVAEAQRTQWEAWGQYTDPNPTIVEDPTIAEAAETYKADAITKNLEISTRQDIDQHLRLRLLPFCEAAKVSHVRFFDNARLVRDCVGSWKSVKTGKLLSPETRRAELERFRGFLSWCVAQRWLKENHAKAKDLSVRTEPIKGKFGMNPHEEEWVFDAIGRLVDCYGRTGQRNAEETKTYCLVMRHTGLRISDVTKLDSSQLVKRASGNGWAIQVMQQKKTKEFVRIPHTHSYPVGAKTISEVLVGVPQFNELNVEFRFWNQLARNHGTGTPYRVLEARYSGPSRTWTITVDAVPRTLRHLIQAKIIAEALPSIRLWLLANTHSTEREGIHELAFRFDELKNELTCEDHATADWKTTRVDRPS